jgi:hypothetical protein
MDYGIEFHYCGVDAVLDESSWRGTNTETTLKIMLVCEIVKTEVQLT